MRTKIKKVLTYVTLFCFTLMFLNLNLKSQIIGFYNSATSTNTNPNPITVHGTVYVGKGNCGTNNGGQAQSTAVGNNALAAGNTGGGFCTAIGYEALRYNSIGASNVAIGISAMKATLANPCTGTQNVAVGDNSLNKNQSGGSNLAIGYNSLSNNTTGSSNVAVGSNSLGSNTSGNSNSAFGSGALSGLTTTSNDNTCLGFSSAGRMTSGSSNVAIGKFALYRADLFFSGSSNIAIGAGAMGNQTAGSFNLAIGDLAQVPSTIGSNQLSIQNTIYGFYMGTANASIGIGTSTPRAYNSATSYASVQGGPVNGTVAKLDVNGLTFTNTLVVSCDKRLKKNIQPIKEALKKIVHLKGVKYDWKKEEFKERNLDNTPQIGFLAQEVAEVIPEAVMIDNEGFYALNYNMITPVLTEAIKEQQTQIESQNLEIQNLNSELAELKNKLNQLIPGEIKIKVNSIEVVPNPITGTSLVSYKLDNASNSSFLIISDLQGKLLKQINLPKNQLNGQVQISKKDLPNGMYVFAIVSGNTELQSKKVLVAE